MITREHGATLDLDLAILGNTQREAGERDAHGPGVERGSQRVERAWCGGFGQTIALVDGHACAAEERKQFRVKRRAAGHNPLHASTQHLTQ